MVEESGTPGRFTFELGDEVAELEFRRDGDRIYLVHTGVPDAMEGNGVGGRLVRAAVDYAASASLTIVPECPFARGWLERHPDEAAHASIEWAA